MLYLRVGRVTVVTLQLGTSLACLCNDVCVPACACESMPACVCVCSCSEHAPHSFAMRKSINVIIGNLGLPVSTQGRLHSHVSQAALTHLTHTHTYTQHTRTHNTHAHIWMVFCLSSYYHHVAGEGNHFVNSPQGTERDTKYNR